jgi:antitoxin MazE
MSTVIKSRIVKIGNSQGIRIPKLLLEQSNLGEEVELVLQADQIVVRPIHRVRHGWEEAFKVMSEQGHDELLDGDALVSTDWDEEEWGQGEK